MARIFVYDDREFPDPDPEMTVDQVKATLSDFDLPPKNWSSYKLVKWSW